MNVTGFYFLRYHRRKILHFYSHFYLPKKFCSTVSYIHTKVFQTKIYSRVVKPNFGSPITGPVQNISDIFSSIITRDNWIFRTFQPYILSRASLKFIGLLHQCLSVKNDTDLFYIQPFFETIDNKPFALF